MSKLQTEDIVTLRQRVQRLQERKKEDIMNKEAKDKSITKEVDKRMGKLVDMRYMSRVHMLQKVD